MRKRKRKLKALVATVTIAVGMTAGILYASGSSEPTYQTVWCHLAGVNGMATYVALPPTSPTPAIPDYQSPRWTGDTHPCGL